MDNEIIILRWLCDGMTLSGVELRDGAWIFAAMARVGLCDKQKSQRLKALRGAALDFCSTFYQEKVEKN
jgi:hypothetical protein